MRKTLKSKQGITLVALVVTIIVLLILAGVTITSLLGEDGIIAKAQRAAEETNSAVQSEQEGINALLEQLNNYGNGNSSGGEETTSIPEELEKYILGEDKQGILATDIFDMQTMKFKDNEIIPDASTSLIYLDMTNGLDCIYLVFKYNDVIYIGVCDITTYKTKELYVKKKIYEGAELLVNNSIELINLTESITPVNIYEINITINEEKITVYAQPLIFITGVIVAANIGEQVGIELLDNVYIILQDNAVVIMDGEGVLSDTVVLNSIYEVGLSGNYVEENGFGAFLSDRGWELCKTPNTNYEIPTKVAGYTISAVVMDAIDGVPTFIQPAALITWSDPLSPSSIKITTSDLDLFFSANVSFERVKGT